MDLSTQRWPAEARRPESRERVARFDGYADGSAFDRARLVGDANLNFTEFGYFCLSMWGAVGSRSLESVLASKCRFSRWVALYRAVDLRDKGLGIVPTGAAPHYDASAGAMYGQGFGSVQITARPS